MGGRFGGKGDRDRREVREGQGRTGEEGTQAVHDAPRAGRRVRDAPVVRRIEADLAGVGEGGLGRGQSQRGALGVALLASSYLARPWNDLKT